MTNMIPPTNIEGNNEGVGTDTIDSTIGAATLTAVPADSVTTKGHQLCYLVIQELAMNRKAPTQLRDDVFLSMCHCISEILEKHVMLFRGMVNRVDVSYYQMFASIAHELFESNSNSFDSVRLNITWARILSLFAFSVRLAQEHRNDPERVDLITRFLTIYVSKYITPFVRVNGGWAGLVQQFPPPTDGNSQFKKAILISGLCVGIVATMFITSLLTK